MRILNTVCTPWALCLGAGLLAGCHSERTPIAVNVTPASTTMVQPAESAKAPAPAEALPKVDPAPNAKSADAKSPAATPRNAESKPDDRSEATVPKAVSPEAEAAEILAEEMYELNALAELKLLMLRSGPTRSKDRLEALIKRYPGTRAAKKAQGFLAKHHPDDAT